MEPSEPLTFCTRAVNHEANMDDRRERTSEYMDLDNASTAYLLGKQGVTKNRLAEFTGCGLEIGHAKVALSLTAHPEPHPEPHCHPTLTPTLAFTLNTLPSPSRSPSRSPLSSPSTRALTLAPSPSLSLSPRWS